MKQKVICSLICFLAIAGLIISCGESDTPTQATTSTITSDAVDEIKATELPEINFAAEEQAVQAAHKALDEAINDRDRDPAEVTSHWIKTGSVLMAHNFFGELVTSKSTQKIRGSWKSIFGRRAPWPMKTTIETVSIEEKKGKIARSKGTFEYQSRNKRPFKALYQKDKEGEWKIKAIDYGDNGFIKGFQIIN